MPSDHIIQPLGPSTAAPATHPDDCTECDGPIRQEDHETVCMADFTVSTSMGSCSAVHLPPRI
jgi:hypothetical protein